jgi:hypothetical protein
MKSKVLILYSSCCYHDLQKFKSFIFKTLISKTPMFKAVGIQSCIIIAFRWQLLWSKLGFQTRWRKESTTSDTRCLRRATGNMLFSVIFFFLRFFNCWVSFAKCCFHKHYIQSILTYSAFSDKVWFLFQKQLEFNTGKKVTPTKLLKAEKLNKT